MWSHPSFNVGYMNVNGCLPYQMSYVQVRHGDQVLTRSMTIDPSGKVGGYPAYRALWTNNRTSVLSILYRDNGSIYLTEDKSFKLVIVNGNMYFSSNTGLSGVDLDSMGVVYVPWYREWANQTNTFPSFNALVVPPITPAETLDMLSNMRIPISLYRNVPDNQGRNIPWADQGAWIGSVAPDGRTKGDSNPSTLRAFFSWWPASENYASHFYLVRADSDWALMPTLKGVADFQSLGITARPVNDGAYVGDWGESNANRWSYSNNYIMTMTINHVGGPTYQFWHGDRRLNQASHWLRLQPFIDVYNGVEFYNGNDIGLMNIDIAIVDNSTPDLRLDDTMVYRLGPYVRAMANTRDTLSFYNINPANVTENMPRQMATCDMNPWDGTLLSCYSEGIPYTNTIGSSECTTPDDFNDVHCQQWAIANKGPTMETRIRDLCGGATYDNPPLCNCFLPDTVYYNAVANQYGSNVANSIRATNIAQCQSGLCDENGSISSRLFYYGNRKCDYCVQAVDLAIQAKTITNTTITPIQQCAKTDSTYTWDDLISFLIYQGAYVYGSTPTTHTYKDVILSSDRTHIFLNISTATGKEAMSKMSVLKYIPPAPIDSHVSSQLPFIKNVPTSAYILISEDTWKSNISGYSTDIRGFMLLDRVLVQSSQR